MLELELHASHTALASNAVKREVGVRAEVAAGGMRPHEAHASRKARALGRLLAIG